jgi:hypothetical protein
MNIGDLQTIWGKGNPPAWPHAEGFLDKTTLEDDCKLRIFWKPTLGLTALKECYILTRQ